MGSLAGIAGLISAGGNILGQGASLVNTGVDLGQYGMRMQDPVLGGILQQYLSRLNNQSNPYALNQQSLFGNSNYGNFASQNLLNMMQNNPANGAMQQLQQASQMQRPGMGSFGDLFSGGTQGGGQGYKPTPRDPDAPNPLASMGNMNAVQGPQAPGPSPDAIQGQVGFPTQGGALGAIAPGLIGKNPSSFVQQLMQGMQGGQGGGVAQGSGPSGGGGYSNPFPGYFARQPQGGGGYSNMPTGGGQFAGNPSGQAGLQSMFPQFFQMLQNAGKAPQQAQAAPGATGSAPSTASASTTATAKRLPSYDTGTGYVPQTGPAILHQGEAVVPAHQNPANQGGLTGNLTSALNSNVNQAPAGSQVGFGAAPQAQQANQGGWYPGKFANQAWSALSSRFTNPQTAPQTTDRYDPMRGVPAGDQSLGAPQGQSQSVPQQVQFSQPGGDQLQSLLTGQPSSSQGGQPMVYQGSAAMPLSQEQQDYNSKVAQWYQSQMQNQTQAPPQQATPQQGQAQPQTYDIQGGGGTLGGYGGYDPASAFGQPQQGQPSQPQQPAQPTLADQQQGLMGNILQNPDVFSQQLQNQLMGTYRDQRYAGLQGTQTAQNEQDAARGMQGSGVEAYLQNQNRQQANQDIAGFGGQLGQTAATANNASRMAAANQGLQQVLGMGNANLNYQSLQNQMFNQDRDYQTSLAGQMFGLGQGGQNQLMQMLGQLGGNVSQGQGYQDQMTQLLYSQLANMYAPTNAAPYQYAPSYGFGQQQQQQGGSNAAAYGAAASGIGQLFGGPTGAALVNMFKSQPYSGNSGNF